MFIKLLFFLFIQVTSKSDGYTVLLTSPHAVRRGKQGRGGGGDIDA